MKYWISFPAECGQWAGIHWFHSKDHRKDFMQLAKKAGADMSKAKLGAI